MAKLNILTLGSSKTYTKESLLGGGAVVGKNVTVSSITPIEGGNRVTFSYTLDNGTVKTSTMDVMDGKDGIDGLPGKDGQSGTDGSDGVGISKIEKISTVDLVDTYRITFTDNSTFDYEVTNGKDGQGGGTADVPIEKIKVNGELQTPVNKVVDITVPSIEGLTKDADLATVAKSGSYEDLSNKPIIPSLDGYAKTSEIPSKVSELENDSNYLSSIPEEYVTETELEAKGYLTEHQDISGKVDKVEGKSLISDTEIARLASVDNYDDTDIRTEIAKKADTTAIPSKVSELTNDSNYQTESEVNSIVTTEIAKVVADAPEDLNTLKEMSDWIAGHENDASAMNSAISDNKTAITALQTGKADKSEIPTTVSELTDSADYAKKTDLHSHDNKSVLDGITSDKVTYWDNKSEFSGSYNDLNDKPTIDAELSNTSENAIQNKVVTKEINKLYSDISFNDFDTATDGISFTDAEDGNMIVTDWTRNLFNHTLETHESGGITCTQNVDTNGNPDGTYTLNGTATKDRWISFGYTTLNPGKYKFIATENNVEVNNLCVTSKQTSIAIPGNIFTIQSKSVCDIGLSTWNKTFNNVLIKPMITTDLSATYDDFVPYGGYKIKTCGKNLFHNVEIITNTMNIEAKLTDDAGIKLNGTTPYDPNWKDVYVECQATKLEKGKTYCLSVKDALDGLYIILRRRNSSNVFKELNLHDRFIIFTWDKDDEYIRYTLTVKSQQTFNNVTIYPQLEEVAPDATEPTDFEPYTGETITVTNDTESPEFGLKSHKDITNIISPGNVKCVYPTNESGKGVLDSLYNKDKCLRNKRMI